MSRPDTYLPQLTGMRAIAAYCVFLHHYKPVSPALWNGWPARFIEELHIGVWVFYVLSGFLIYYRYGHDFEQWSAGHMWQYAKNRVARIYPVYYVLLLVTYLVYEFPSPTVGAVHLTLTQGFFPNYAATGIVQAWTLTVEESFYFTAPLLFYFARRWTLLAPCIVLPAVGLMLDYQTGTPFALLRTLLGAIVAFAVGSFIAQRLMQMKSRPRRQPLAWRTYTGALATIAAIAAMSVASGPPKLAIHLVILPVMIAWAFWGLLTERSLPRSVLSARWMVLLGSSSYSFYLIHLGATADLFQAIVSDQLWILFIGLNVISIALYKLVERPSNRWLRNLGRPKTERTIAADAVPADFIDRLIGRFGVRTIMLLLLVSMAVCAFPWRAQLHSRVLQVRGHRLLSEQRFDEAHAVLARSTELWPSNVEATVLSGRIDYLRGNFTATVNILRDVAETHPTDFDAQLYLGLGLIELGDVDAALAHLRAAVGLRPNNVESRTALGLLAMQSGRLDEAQQQFQSLVKMRPRSADFHCHLATILFARNQPDKARAELEKAMRIDPDHQPSHELLKRIEDVRVGRPELWYSGTSAWFLGSDGPVKSGDCSIG